MAIIGSRVALAGLSGREQTSPEYAAHGFVGIHPELWAKVLRLSASSKTLVRELEGCCSEGSLWEEKRKELEAVFKKLEAAVGELNVSAFALAPPQFH